MWRLEAFGCALAGTLTGVAIAAGLLIRQNQHAALGQPRPQATDWQRGPTHSRTPPPHIQRIRALSDPPGTIGACSARAGHDSPTVTAARILDSAEDSARGRVAADGAAGPEVHRQVTRQQMIRVVEVVVLLAIMIAGLSGAKWWVFGLSLALGTFVLTQWMDTETDRRNAGQSTVQYVRNVVPNRKN